jgi:hypothetical protein
MEVADLAVGEPVLQPPGVRPRVLAAAHAASLADVDHERHARLVQGLHELLSVEAIDADRRDPGHGAMLADPEAVRCANTRAYRDRILGRFAARDCQAG